MAEKEKVVKAISTELALGALATLKLHYRNVLAGANRQACRTALDVVGRAVKQEAKQLAVDEGLPGEYRKGLRRALKGE